MLRSDVHGHWRDWSEQRRASWRFSSAVVGLLAHAGPGRVSPIISSCTQGSGLASIGRKLYCNSVAVQEVCATGPTPWIARKGSCVHGLGEGRVRGGGGRVARAGREGNNAARLEQQRALFLREQRANHSSSSNSSSSSGISKTSRGRFACEIVRLKESLR